MGMKPIMRRFPWWGRWALPLSLVVLAVCCTQVLPAFAAPGAQDWTFVDNLNDLSHLADYSHFPGMGIDTTNTAYFDGDPARLNRDATNAAYATWHAHRPSRHLFLAAGSLWPVDDGGLRSGDELVHDGPDDHAERWCVAA